MRFSISVNAEEVARELNADRDAVEKALKEEIKTLASRTHAFLVAKATSDLKGFMREHYLGRQGSGSLGNNLRLHHVSDVLHVIELDPKAHWIEDGRPATFIGDWVLKSPKAKTAKDGSKYIAIPFKLASLKGGKGGTSSTPALEVMAKAALRGTRPKIHATRTQYDEKGRPIHGKIRDVPIEEPGRHVGGFYSRPRSAEMAAATGLPAHQGIFYGAGAQLRQTVTPPKRPGGKPSVSRDIMTFRTLSSKHAMEGRWMYPEVKAFKGFEAAYEWAQQQLDIAMGELGRAIGIGGGT